MTNTDNLIPLDNTNNSKIQAERGAKGGSVCSDNKKLAARLRELKKKGLEDGDSTMLLGMMTDNKLYGLEILKFLTGWIAQCKSPTQAAMLGNTLVNLQKSVHGETIKTENTNTNINIQMDMVKFQELQNKYHNEDIVDVEVKEK